MMKSGEKGANEEKQQRSRDDHGGLGALYGLYYLFKSTLLSVVTFGPDTVQTGEFSDCTNQMSGSSKWPFSINFQHFCTILEAFESSFNKESSAVERIT